MTPDRAIDIVRRINARYFLAMGISQEPVLPSLDGVSLAEMLEATGTVGKINDTTTAGTGPKAFYVVPDDRLIAAVYTVVNYHPEASPIAMEPRKDDFGQWQMTAVAVVDLADQSEVATTRAVA